MKLLHITTVSFFIMVSLVAAVVSAASSGQKWWVYMKEEGTCVDTSSGEYRDMTPDKIKEFHRTSSFACKEIRREKVLLITCKTPGGNRHYLYGINFDICMDIAKAVIIKK